MSDELHELRRTRNDMASTAALLRRILTEIDWRELVDDRLLILDGGISLNGDEAHLIRSLLDYPHGALAGRPKTL